MKNYGFEQVTSSLGYPKSNCKVENSVKIAKRLMKKAATPKSDPFLSLLNRRNTPTEREQEKVEGKVNIDFSKYVQKTEEFIAAIEGIYGKQENAWCLEESCQIL